VHGGQHLAAPVIVTPAVMADMEALIPLAPLHQPHSLHAMRALFKLRPGLRQVACFDTAFHRGHADAVRRCALPRALSESGIERYGFHGLSYEYIARRLAEIAPSLAKGQRGGGASW
jgi:acetate kinase